MRFLSAHFLSAVGIGTFFIMSHTQSMEALEAQEFMSPPRAAKIESTKTFHGTTLSDPYAWLRDSAWKGAKDGVQNTEIMAYITAENAYTQHFINTQQRVVDQYIETRKSMIQIEDQSVPIDWDGFFYYSRQAQTENYPVYCRRKGQMDTPEIVYFDQNREAKEHKFFKLGALAVSPDHNLLAYTADTSGNEFFTIRVRDLTTNDFLPVEINNTSPTIIWHPDGRGFYYLRLDESWRSKFLCFHHLGSDPQDDLILYTEDNNMVHMGIERSNDRSFLFLNSSTKDDDAIYALDLRTESDGKLRQIIDRQEKRHAEIEHQNGFFYIITNDLGQNFRLVKTPTHGDTTDWTEILPHNPDRYLTGIQPYAQGIVVSSRENGLNCLSILKEEGQSLTKIPMMDPTYAASLTGMPYTSPTFRYHYSSLSKPAQVVQVAFNDLQQTVLKTQELPCGFNSDYYQTERLEITARDGVKVPVSLVYRKDLFKNDGSNPLFLYGYGSYGHAIETSFNESSIIYADAGFVYAIAHVRGGSDLGYNWYLEGKMNKKWHTFHDFIDAAQELCEKKYTHVGKISAMGGSAGGMLMGVIANEAPDLFTSIVAHVPFVDVINTMTDESLPLTPGEFVEWGNPITNPEAFAYMASYCPYTNTRPQAYPAMWITAGLYDSRVTYWEGLKWVAKLRENHTGTTPIFMDMNTDAGHGGGSSRSDRLKEAGKVYAFVMKMHGINPQNGNS